MKFFTLHSCDETWETNCAHPAIVPSHITTDVKIKKIWRCVRLILWFSLWVCNFPKNIVNIVKAAWALKSEKYGIFKYFSVLFSKWTVCFQVTDWLFSYRDIPRIPESSHPPLESSKNSLKLIFHLHVRHSASFLFEIWVVSKTLCQTAGSSSFESQKMDRPSISVMSPTSPGALRDIPLVLPGQLSVSDTITQKQLCDSIRGCQPPSPFTWCLQVKLWYDKVGHQLIVNVLQAIDLPTRPDGRPRNPYVKMYFLPDRRYLQSVRLVLALIHAWRILKAPNSTFNFNQSFECMIPFSGSPPASLLTSFFGSLSLFQW